MRLFRVILFSIAACAVAFSGGRYGRPGGPLTFDFHDVELRAALDSLITHYGVPVLFVDAEVKGTRVSARCDGCSEEQALDALLKPTNLHWRIVGAQYVIEKRTPGQTDANVIVSGFVADSLTGLPVENAVVFIAGTSSGTSTDVGGRFRLRSPWIRACDLVISRVGYVRCVIPIHVAAGDSLFLGLSLAPALIRGEQVQVTAREPDEWKNELALFEKKFFGGGKFSDRCSVMNPYVIDFAMRGDTLVGSSDSLVWIVNPDLGYTMAVAISTFRWDTRRDQGDWKVFVMFRESTPVSPADREAWSANRRAVYEVSLRHFLRALIQRRTIEEGYLMTAGKSLDQSRRWTRVGETEIAPLPGPDGHLLAWTYPDWVRVDDPRFSKVPGLLRPVETVALIDSLGNLVTPLAFELGGRWSWERVGSLLPADCDPGNSR